MKEGLKRELDEEDKADFENAVAHLMQAMSIKNMMVTMSEKGVMITDGKLFHYIPAHIRKIADVSGAGDTVISVAALGMALGLSNKELAAIANLAGGLVCEEVGVVPIDLDRFTEELKTV